MGFLFMYDKKIAYVHYIKNDGLMGNAGHVKVMLRGNGMSIEVYIRDMQILPNGYYRIKSIDENLLEDKIHIEKGQAVYKKRINVDKCEKGQVPAGIKIEINENEYLEAVWQAEEKQSVEIREEVQIAETRAAEKRVEAPREVEPKVEVKKEWTAEKEETLAKSGNAWSQLTFSVPTEVYEEKWKELCKKYEIVHPFGNQDEYISIAPKDFIIFPEKYQNLVNNSFLLHGYYNYQHIILGRKEDGGKNIYYIGVPGVYYEREKMVAIMFGFEGFECGDKRANNGGFGYYMRRVEL